MIGFLVAGLVIGALMGVYRKVERALDIYIYALLTAPSLVFAPPAGRQIGRVTELWGGQDLTPRFADNRLKLTFAPACELMAIWAEFQ